MPKNNIWNTPSKYGTYTGERGSPQQWSGAFNVAFENSDSVKHILGMSAYQILGLNPTCTDDEVSKAYRKLARKYHPDKNPNNAIALNKFREATTAYEIIENLRNRQPVQIQFTATVTVPKRKRTVVDTDDTDEIIIDETIVNVSPSNIIIPQLLTQIEENEVETYLTNSEFCVQEKKDGKHLTLQILNGQLIVRNKKGTACNCAPEFENSLRAIGCDLLIDGEQIGDKFWAWDILEFDGVDIRNWSYLSRYLKLTKLSFGPAIQILKIAFTEQEKQALYSQLKSNGKEGIVFKKLSGQFKPGKGDDQLKFKFYAECSVIVVEGRQGRASIGMELINSQGDREFVGYCSCNRHPPIGSVAEIKYLYAYRGGCLYQPAFKEVRDDVDINECTTSQLKYKSTED